MSKKEAVPKKTSDGCREHTTDNREVPGSNPGSGTNLRKWKYDYKK